MKWNRLHLWRVLNVLVLSSTQHIHMVQVMTTRCQRLIAGITRSNAPVPIVTSRPVISLDDGDFSSSHAPRSTKSYDNVNFSCYISFGVLVIGIYNTHFLTTLRKYSEWHDVWPNRTQFSRQWMQHKCHPTPLWVKQDVTWPNDALHRTCSSMDGHVKRKPLECHSEIKHSFRYH